MRILVQKFGGTSVATEHARERVIEKIVNAKKEYDAIIVVVSAMGRKGFPYSTDTLLDLIGKESNLSPREIDMLISCGEIISSVVISNLLLNCNVKACALTGGNAGIITDDNYNRANIINIDTNKLLSFIEEGYIPVIAGFQGVSTNGHITTIGRGGSDTTAVLLGEALGATSIEIYTDVDGIMTADPKVCSSAKIINEISYNEVFQMADSGAKVIHPSAVEIARRAGIPLYIRNTFNETSGTNITGYNMLIKRNIKDKLITSIAHRKDRTQFTVEGHIDDKLFFEELAYHDVSIDIINIFPKKRVFTIDSDKKSIVLKILNNYETDTSFIDNCCKVTVIGEKMTGVPGVMARIIKSLNEVGVEILQTADSLATIACLIYEEDLEKSVIALHKEFELE